MIVMKEDFYRILDEKREKSNSFQLLVIFRYCYEWEDIKKQPWQMEVVCYRFDNYDYTDYMWFNDWDEGQTIIEILRIIPEEDIIKACLLSGKTFSDMENS